jgi:phage virion morphogenesis protein
MVAQFNVTTQGGLEIERRLARLAEAFGDLTPLMEGIGLHLEGSTMERFETETAPDGKPWKPSKRALLDGGKTLSDSTQLRSSIVSEAGSDQVAVGSNKIYAGVHNDGAIIRAKTAKGMVFQLPGGLGFRRVMQVELPARTFLGLSREDETEIVALTEDYARDAMGGAA